MVFEIQQNNQFLSELIDQNDFENDTRASIDILQQMMSIVKYLHSNGMMHRNLNPDCFILNRSLNKLWIFDLGSSCRIDQLTAKPTLKILFSSPEILKNDPYS